MRKCLFLLGAILGVILTGFVLTGCHKSTTTIPDTDISPAEDASNAFFVANDLKNISDASVQGHSSYAPSPYRQGRGIGVISPCANVHGDTLSINSVNGTIIDTVVYIEFGPSDCICNDGRNRRGTIIVYWPLATGNFLQSYFDSANAIGMTFNNYYLNDNGILGEINWTNKGINGYGYENWSFRDSLIIKYSNGHTATWKSQLNNALTVINSAEYYQVTGNAYGTAQSGDNYTLTITNPLTITAEPAWSGGCAWIESGIIYINRASSINLLTANYGNTGVCDDSAIATISGNSYPFTMW